jgi:hypothetical protein
MRAALLALLLLLPAPAVAQASYGCCGFRDWATYGSGDLLRYHPTAHGLGGIGMDLVARGPWFAKSFRDKVWKRLAIVAIGGMAWQFQNLKEIEGYRWDYAVFDVGMDLIGAGAAELLLR